MTHSDLSAERPRNEPEPLLPIEKKLIGWSFGLGVALILVLALINHVFPIAQ
jgi:hypothetical protein